MKGRIRNSKARSTEKIPPKDLTDAGNEHRAEPVAAPGMLGQKSKADIAEIQTLARGSQISTDYSQDLHIDDGDLPEVCFAQRGFRM